MRATPEPGTVVSVNGELAIDAEALSWAQSRIVGTHDELRDRRNAVRGQARALLGDGWRGVAAEQYAEAWECWQEAAELVLASMLDLCGAMTLAEAQLDVADLDSAVSAARLQIRLAGG